MCVYFLGNRIKFDAKIDKKRNSKQIILHFFSFYLKHRAKKYPNMK